MSDVIKLLPAHIANQIAAGEVVQRPSSVVKELLENAIDAGAMKINLIAKDGGKTLIQVVDNGCGMSDIDARLSFERHATSKIVSADDLFALQTKGFRGEALASISAIAQVSLKSKLHDAELGTKIINKGSKIASQESVICPNGTSISVKNLFFNIPARRNFLGKDMTEYRKVLDEFLRLALVHPEIKFSFHHNGEEIFNLAESSIRQRIVQLFGNAFNERLVPVNEETDIVKIRGFVTKPENAKSKSDQSYLFVNNRFFKDRYLSHAILNAYDGLIPPGKYPPYFIYFDVPTQSIDVNVHPNKTEIKFEENQAIYTFLRSAVKQALGQFNVAPTLDFEQEASFNAPTLKEGEIVQIPEIKVNPEFNPFESTKPSSFGISEALKASGFGQIRPSKEEWENFYGEKIDTDETGSGSNISPDKHNEMTYSSSIDEQVSVEKKKPVQINDKYILSSVKNGFILIDQYRAHLRILFDEMMEEGHVPQIQQLLFEEKIRIQQQDLPLWKEMLDEVNALGFEVILDKNELTIKGQPVHAKEQNPIELLRTIFESYEASEQNDAVEIKSKLALSLASGLAIKGGVGLNIEEMEYIIDALFASSSPRYSPQGKKIIETFSTDEIIKRFS